MIVLRPLRVAASLLAICLCAACQEGTPSSSVVPSSAPAATATKLASRPSTPLGNPILPDFYADPSARVFDGKLYIYPSHDAAGARNWKGMLTVRIPANASAVVTVPALDANSVREGNQGAKDAPGVKLLRPESSAAIFAVGSGVYEFQSRLKP